MPRTSKSTMVIERLLEERRQYEAWIARVNRAEDATPEAVRARVRADYEARLKAVTEELKAHVDAARQTIEQKQHFRAELQRKETQAAEKLAETELRHAVGEYDDAQWSQSHKDVLAELVAVREELQAVEADIAKLEEVEAIVRASPKPAPKPAAAPAPTPAPSPAPAGAPTFGPSSKPFRAVVPGAPAPSAPPPAAAVPVAAAPVPAAPPAPPPAPAPSPRPHLDELAFIKSVTEDEKGGGPSARRASGAQYQPAIPEVGLASPTPVAAPTPATNPDEPRTLKCKECGTMNLPTEWYCEQCGAELAAL